MSFFVYFSYEKILFYLCFYNLANALPLQDPSIDLKTFKELCVALDISLNNNIVVETQKNWLRSSTKERWEMEELPESKKNFVVDWAQKEGHFNSWNPTLGMYDQIVILGGTTPRMKLRLEYLEKLIDKGIAFDGIIWLASDRPLDPKVDHLSPCAKTEIEAAQILWKESDLSLKHLSMQFFSAPMKGNKRPVTEDLLCCFLKQRPYPQKVLFLSNQPFCGAQFETIKNILPKDVSFDVAGPACSKDSLPSMAAVFLDSLARWIYQKEDFNEQFSLLNEQ